MPRIPGEERIAFLEEVKKIKDLLINLNLTKGDISGKEEEEEKGKETL